MVFTPADGETARWRRVDEYIDTGKCPGDLITFREIQDLLDVDKIAAAAVIHQVRVQREKAGKRTLVTMRGAGWLLARPDQELEEDTRRHEHLLNTADGRVRLLGSIQGRRAELSGEERRILDFRQAQAAAQATVLGSRKASAADILSTGGSQPVPITAQGKREGGASGEHSRPGGQCADGDQRRDGQAKSRQPGFTIPAAPVPSPAGDGGTAAPLFQAAPATPPDEPAAGEIPLVNPFDQHAALWPPEEDHLCWLVVPVSDPDTEAAAELAVRYGGLTGQPGLTVVPPRWLHIMIGHAIPAGDMSPDDLKVMVSVVRERCGRLYPFRARLGAAKIAAGGVACPAGPLASLRGLESIVADARKTADCKPSGAPAVIRAPHVALAYATGHGTTGPLEKWLADWEPGQLADGGWRVSSLLLARVRHDGCRMTWRPVETVAVGRRSANRLPGSLRG